MTPTATDPAPDGAPIAFRDGATYAALPSRFYVRLDPAPAADPRTLRVNGDVARLLGLDPEALFAPDAARALAGAAAPPGARPLAMVYAGHQFGGWSPRLGDGRAMLLGEIVGVDGVRYDLHLKGSGRTPYARGGDGRAALGPVLREFLIAHAMAALGVPTTLSLAAVTTGDAVLREEGPLPGAVLARAAPSHIRFGTFQYFAAQGDVEGLRALLEFTRARHTPELAPGDALGLLRRCVDQTARLIAQWQALGFIHGVMNTDNMSVAGVTIDYGPCAFMDHHDAATVFSAIDHGGRYAYGNQPSIGLWNLTRFAEALLPLIDPDVDAAVEHAKAAVARYPEAFAAALLDAMRPKLGLTTAEADDEGLVTALFAAMTEGALDHTDTLRGLADLAAPDAVVPAALAAWAPRWRARLARDGADPAARPAAMRAASPALIPRNHVVEAALDAAVEGDMALYDRLYDWLATPLDPPADALAALRPPLPHQRVANTFCGT